jgi:hypothetical protein
MHLRKACAMQSGCSTAKQIATKPITMPPNTCCRTVEKRRKLSDSTEAGCGRFWLRCCGLPMRLQVERALHAHLRPPQPRASSMLVLQNVQSARQWAMQPRYARGGGLHASSLAHLRQLLHRHASRKMQWGETILGRCWLHVAWLA